MLLDHDYELVRSPAGAKQWQPIGQARRDMAPGAHSPATKRADHDDHGRHGDEGGPENTARSRERFRDDPA